jgi:ribosomal protein L11 methylase PrmA
MTRTSPDGPIPASFRDPSGFLFRRDGKLLRQVNLCYREHYERLMTSGLYDGLVAAGLLIPHAESEAAPAEAGLAYKVLQPEPIPFISHPYEWCFSQLKDAALTTLRLQKLALERGLSLKDASAYNIQFHRGKPVLIDTLSFESYREGQPWVAYRQFCQHFLAPLALMARVDVRLGQLLRIHLDGLPLDLASRLLPWRTRLTPGLQLHLHLHARSQARYAGQAAAPTGGMSRLGLLGLIDSLESTVRRLIWRPHGTEWADYYSDTSYSEAGLREKQRIVSEFVARADPRTAWDLGANTGRFSRIASSHGALTLAFDLDPAAVERNYLACREAGEENLLPLVLDLTNPSPGVGWRNRERASLLARGPVDLVLALALVHHLAVSNHLPLPAIASFLADLGPHLIIEFVPKDDPQVQRLLATRDDIFSDYTQAAFETTFAAHFDLLSSAPVPDSPRVIYLMKRREA